MVGKKIFSAELSEQILDEFTEYVADRGYVKYRCVEAAMRVFMALPSEAQVHLMRDSSGLGDVKQYVTEKLLDAALVQLLSELSPQDRLSLIGDAKKTSKKVSRKR